MRKEFSGFFTKERKEKDRHGKPEKKSSWEISDELYSLVSFKQVKEILNESTNPMRRIVHMIKKQR